MHRSIVLSILLSLALAAAACAAGPDDAVPTPGIILDGPALTHDEAFTHSGAVIPAHPTSAGPRHMAHRNWVEAHRQTADQRCCAEHFGGFGPLWESYCADRGKNCFSATACGPTPCYPTLTLSGILPRRSPSRHVVRCRLQRPNCRGGCEATCDCPGAMSMIDAEDPAPPDPGAPPDPSAPPGPTPALPSEMLDPAPLPPSPQPPAAGEETNASARRSWLQRRATSVPR